MAVEDLRAANSIRHEVVKRCMDSSRMEVRVHHGVCYLSGEARPVQGVQCDLRHEMEVLNSVIRSRREIRDVVNDVRIRDGSD